MKLFGDFERCAQSGTLFHFFVRGHNLFSPPAFPKRRLEFLTNALKEQRESGFPVLRMPSPASALVPDPDNSPLICPNAINVTESIADSKHSYVRLVFVIVSVVIVGYLLV